MGERLHETVDENGVRTSNKHLCVFDGRSPPAHPARQPVNCMAVADSLSGIESRVK